MALQWALMGPLEKPTLTTKKSLIGPEVFLAQFLFVYPNFSWIGILNDEIH
jgi:hypothetical protein